MRLTNEGRRKYAVALARPCRIVACGGSVRLEVHAENDKEAEEIAEFIAAAAGYIPTSLYEKYFEEEESNV